QALGAREAARHPRRRVHCRAESKRPVLALPHVVVAEYPPRCRRRSRVAPFERPRTQELGLRLLQAEVGFGASRPWSFLLVRTLVLPFAASPQAPEEPA